VKEECKVNLVGDDLASSPEPLQLLESVREMAGRVVLPMGLTVEAQHLVQQNDIKTERKKMVFDPGF
jgi:hypothetical protein